MARRRWTWIVRRGKTNAELRGRMSGRCGVYAVRDASTRTVLYVGESHSNRAWKTALRHLHAWESFEGVREWTHRQPGRLEMCFEETPCHFAPLEEANWIDELRPLHNLEVRDAEKDEPAPF